MESEVGGEPLQAAEEIQPEIVAIDELDLENPAHLSTMNPYFKKMDLSQDIIDVLSRKGISSFTPVQAEAFEPIYLSRDVLCRSRTGTGKTLAFGIPAITRLHKLGAGKINPLTGRKAPPGRLPSMIVLCPTRELARQVAEELRSVAKPLNMEVMEIYGGSATIRRLGSSGTGLTLLLGLPGGPLTTLTRGT